MQIIVLGMHRSGTSTVTRLLNLMGAYLGPEGSLLPAEEKDNPKGYWERFDVVELNDWLLQSVGNNWYQIANFDIQNIPNRIVKEFQDKAKKIALELDTHRPWVVKDPRLCLSLPLWRELLEVPICIFVTRCPIEIAKSLNTRAGFPMQFGVALWEKYMISALEASSGLPRIVVSYKALMEYPLEAVKDIYTKLIARDVQGLRLPGEREITAFIDPRLYRQKNDKDFEDHLISRHQSNLYEILEDQKILENNASLTISKAPATILHDYERLLKEEQLRNQLEVQLQNERTEREQLNQNLQNILSENQLTQEQQSTTISHLHQNLDLSGRQLKLLQDEICHQEHTIDKLIRYFERLNHDFDAAFNSLTWKIGFFIAESARKGIFRPQKAMVQDHVKDLTRAFSNWKRTYLQRLRSNRQELFAFQHNANRTQYLALDSFSAIPSAGSRKLNIGALVARRGDDQPSGSAFIRLIQPFEHPSIKDAVNFHICSLTELLMLDLDIIVVQRNALPEMQEAHSLIDHCQQNKIKLVYEIDDDLFTIDSKSPVKYHRSAHDTINFVATNADLVTTSSLILQSQIKAMNPCVEYLPNAIDETIWLEKQEETFIMPDNSLKDGKTRILYMGTRTHAEDLKMVKKAFKRIKKEYGDLVTLEIIGGIPDGTRSFGEIISLHNVGSPDSDNYIDFVNWIRKLNRWDFGIIPLVQSDFNRKKSYIKFLDYSALGLASICSNIEPYREVVKDKQNGLLVDGDTESWYKAIKSLIDDETLRKTLARNAFSDLIHKHILNNHAINYLRIYKDVLAADQQVFSSDVRRKKLKEISQWSSKPLISIVMPVYDVERRWIHEAVESVRKQIYPHWELCIADDHSNRDETVSYLKEIADEKIKIKFLEKNQGISGASNAALALAQGQFIALMDHDDELTADALYEVIKAINEHDPDLIYSDEDKISVDGKLVEPHFKPDFSPDMILSQNYISHLGVYRKSIVDEIGGFRKGFEGSQDYDLLLRFLDKTNKVHHIPKVLYHWRKVPGSTAEIFDSKSYAWEAGRRALQETMQRRQIDAQVELGPFSGTYRVKRKIIDHPLVSIIIPFKDKPELLRNCIDSILKNSTYGDFEILGINNNSSNPEVFELIKYYKSLDERIYFKEYNSIFNFSAIINFATASAKGEHLIFLNNDVTVITPGWIEALLEHSQRPEVGAVGAKLYYPDGTIQHAGIIIGIGGVAGHSHKYLEKRSHGYFSRPFLIQNLSAVTAACLMIKKKTFNLIGGLDQKNLAVAFNDVDLCLRLSDIGYLNIYTPYCEMYHYESKSRGFEDTTEKQARFLREVDYMKKRHRNILTSGDPYYNPNLTLDSEDFSFIPANLRALDFEYP